ncbi:TPA: aspartate--tRNA(Asn) ligase [Candidatus Micrarchaeota archaeon]|jgi:aspartyl-tRNA synthetase|nr:aspartate--tRNA(Asn) ligase [Candidatus Micrarchaeota archaeon]
MVNELNESMDGKEVALAGWVHEVRETSKITFLLLRDSTGIVQIIGKDGETDKKVMKAMAIPKESVVKIVGTVKVNATAKKGFEVLIKSIENLNPISAMIPFEVTGKVPADIDVRLNSRCIDLRRPVTAAIFKIQSTLANAFLESLTKKGFVHIKTPSIIAEASEGGADLFPIAYFEEKAYLAQSPQLYKQLAVIGGLEKVVIETPVFRAEKSNTVYHLTESNQMDIEMAFAGADEALEVLTSTFKDMIRAVIKENQAELKLLGVDLKVPEIKHVEYTEVIKALKKDGFEIEFGDDISRAHEPGIVKLYGDAVYIRKFPTALRAFYSMPCKDNPELTESYDFIYKGLEILSGAQRIHIPELLIEALKKKGMNPKNFEFYINSFRYGAPPHAGWSIGLERLTMKIVGANNIRECSMFPRDRKRLTP